MSRFLIRWLSATWLVSASLCAGENLAPVDKAWFMSNYTKAEIQIPMRDGVKLFTAVYAPKETNTAYPIWLTRTPYGIGPYGSNAFRDPSGPLKFYARERFIFVLQDVRGRHSSEGEYEQIRPIDTTGRHPDESTDAWDTIDWLVKHIANNNGRVGLSGISYPGFYAACGAINSHPALKAVSPQAPIGDWFVGDDYHCNGALYLASSFASGINQMRERPEIGDKVKPLDFGTHDGYRYYLGLGALAGADPRSAAGQAGFWDDIIRHGTYDQFWQARDECPHLTNVHAAVLMVGGWFDAEDLYGALSVWRHIDELNPGIVNTIAMGPWSHGGWHSSEGRQLGAVDFQSATSDYFRQNVELPFFKYYLKGGPAPEFPKAVMFETGRNQWRRFENWPPKEAVEQSLYFTAGGGLSSAPQKDHSAFDEYVSDPARPVPFTQSIALGAPRDYMAADQRFAATRPDVLVYQTEPLTQDMTLAGPVTADLHVSTTGTDSDWVVKLIDVYPADATNPSPNPAGVEMGGYEQLVRGTPMRGKFRRSLEKPEPFTPGKVTEVRWTMPDVCHTFLRGHRVMVQVQSTWFPLFDRNPQVFCDIYHAKPEDFRKATQRVFRTASAPSRIGFLLLPSDR
jgi:putative CocE/NonD family hydrolase